MTLEVVVAMLAVAVSRSTPLVLGALSGLTSERAGAPRRGPARRRIAALSKQYGLAVDPDATVGELPVGVQQRIEIVKALYRRADVLLLDEPTAVLTPQESDGKIVAKRRTEEFTRGEIGLLMTGAAILSS